MKTEIIPYLVQRASFKKRENRIGIDAILSFDYMGSSEFEWGALPASLKRIRANIANFKFYILFVGDKSITVFSDQSVELLQEYLDKLAKNTFHCKEFTAFDKYIKGGEYFSNKFDFWWDIQNDIMWWRQDDEFANNFKNAIK